MENNYLFKTDTAWQFPVIQYTANVSYVEVRKASGIAYILLQLIINSEEQNEKISGTLYNLGVPYDIHYIFADEICKMISIDIVRMRNGRNFSTDIFDICNISDFEVTETGKILFSKGTVPTGNTSVKKLYVYYDPSKKDTKSKSEKIFRMENSVIDEKCVGDVLLNNSDVERYIEDNMGSYSFRKGEEITGYDHETPALMVLKAEDTVELKISDEKLYISAKDKDRDLFIKKNYSAEVISGIISAKKKYRFPENFSSFLKNYCYSEISDISDIKMPYQLTNVLRQKVTLALGCDKLMSNAECAVSGDEASDILEKFGISGVSSYFDNGNLYNILSGKFLIDVDGITGKSEINLVVIQKLPENLKQNVLDEIFSECVNCPNPLSRYEVIKAVTKISGKSDYAERYSLFLQKQAVNTEDKVNIFMDVHEKFKAMNEWKKVSVSEAKELFSELCYQINIDNLKAKVLLCEKLNKVIGFDLLTFLTYISDPLLSAENEFTVYEAFENLDYETDKILSVVNVLEKYCKDITDGKTIAVKSRLSGQCALLGQSLSELKEITGIYNPYEDVSEADIEPERFLKVMTMYTDSFEKLKKYRIYAGEYFRQFKAFFERFSDLKDILTIEAEAVKNPKNITVKYIEQLLKKSRYKDAVCDLHIKLQYELNRLFNTSGASTFELLSDSGISDFLTEEELGEMHLLRACRNGFQHPRNKRNVKYSGTIIKKWCEIVIKLGEF